MDITKCDICKKIKKDEFGLKTKWLSGYISGIESLNFDLCEKCSAKIIAYLKKYLNIKKEK